MVVQETRAQLIERLKKEQEMVEKLKKTAAELQVTLSSCEAAQSELSDRLSCVCKERDTLERETARLQLQLLESQRGEESVLQNEQKQEMAHLKAELEKTREREAGLSSECAELAIKLAEAEKAEAKKKCEYERLVQKYDQLAARMEVVEGEQGL